MDHAIKEPDFEVPEISNKEMIDKIMYPVETPITLKEKLLFLFFGIAMLWGAWEFWQQTQRGLGVTGLNVPVYWGWYIVTFVFWIGVAHAGTLISGILRLSGAEWKSSVTRVSEVITLFTLPMAAAFPFIHVGRNGIVFFMLPYPNFRHLWPDFRSPLMWDFFAISTYTIGTLVFVYSTLVPDLGILRTRVTGWKRTLYTILSWGWRGTQAEWKRAKEAAALCSVLILPVVFSVHTIVGMDFAMQKTPAWHETIFGPYFVIGALYAGVASAVITMALLRWTLPFKDIIQTIHFDYMGRIFLCIDLAWNYMLFNDFMPHFYAHDVNVMNWFKDWLFGHYAPMFWIMFCTNFIIPTCCLAFRGFRKSPLGMFFLACGVTLGMYIERVLIVVEGAETYNGLVRNVHMYFPSVTELSVIFATFCFVFAGIMAFVRIFPIIPIWEMLETKSRQKVHEVAGKKMIFFKWGE